MTITDSTIALAAKAVAWAIDALSSFLRRKRELPVRELKYRSHDRRGRKDRRKSPIDQRVRTGIWLQYHRDTRSGEFDLLSLNAHTRRRVHDAIWPEIVKYHFHDPQTGSAVPAQMALDTAMESVWKSKASLPNHAKQQQAVFVMEAIAVELVNRFKIATIDNRQNDRRASLMSHPS
ncbi:MAG: hypothetical protein ABI972_29335 [Acidobacteriota bacterium]